MGESQDAPGESSLPQLPQGPEIEDAVIIQAQNRSLRLRGRERWVIGRGNESDVVLNSPAVSRVHGTLARAGHGWQYRDQGSTNGTWQGETRVNEVQIVGGPVALRLGGREDGIEVIIVPDGDRTASGQNAEAPTSVPAQRFAVGGESVHVVAGETREWTDPLATSVHELRAGWVRIGRAADSDIVIDDLMVSRRHAALRIDHQGVLLLDQGSANGTYVAGQPVTQYWLRQGEMFSIGPSQFRLDGPGMLTQVNQDRDVRFGSHALTVALDDGRVLVNDINLTLRPRSLMAMIGPSGAGKSTLLGALTGLRPATSGTVTYAGQDLYRDYAQLRQRIGFVPQDDILHTALTVEQALTFGAELRFPADTSAAERAHRVREVAAELQLTERLQTPISRLSGGERKRASTALELLTGPALLFLDEPTSGLDTDLDREVMRLLRRLADDGRTVVVVTHNLEHLDVCDAVMLLASGGHIAYLGPPDGAFAYFGVDSWADVFAELKTKDGAQWAQRFAASPGRGSITRPLLPRPRAVAAENAAKAELAGGQVGKPSRRQQLRTLVRRQLRVTLADRTLVAILVALPVVLALIARVVPNPQGLAQLPTNRDARQLLLVLIVGASLMGSAAAVRELVSERAIYQRERAVGLSWGIYLFAKLLVLGTLAFAQGVVLTLLATAGRRPPSDALVLPSGTAEVALVVALVAMVSSIAGLAISASVREENQAMPLLVLWNMAQLVLCGALVPTVGRIGLEQLSWLLPAKWGFSGTAATVGLNAMLLPGQDPDPSWEHSLSTWVDDLLGLGALAVVAVLITAFLIRRLDPSTGRR